MLDVFYHYKCSVPINGFEIIIPDKQYKRNKLYWGKKSELKPEPSLLLIRDVPRRSFDLFNYADDGLFRNFSLLTSDKEILYFANKYGPLNETQEGEFNGKVELIEPISTWKDHTFEMKYSIELWDRIQKKDSRWLKKRVIWKSLRKGEWGVMYEDKENGRNGWVAGKGDDGTLMKRILKKNLPRNENSLILARLYLQGILNEQLKDRTTIKILYDYEFEKQQLIIMPINLLGFLWFQFAQSVDGGYSFRKCATCKSLFKVKNERGIKKKFCSDACKSKDFRMRTKIITQL